MTARSSTFRDVVEPTVVDASAVRDPSVLLEKITGDWSRAGDADLVAAIAQHPRLLDDRSLLLDLAIHEYRARRGQSPSYDLDQHCTRFRDFGSSVERSIFRQLETQQYLDDHPELLEFVREPRWPVAGEPFGSFSVLEEIGRGAAARVYRCHQTELGHREVVLKVSPFTDFEASILGRLNHPHIIPIFSTGSVDENGLNYLCMPYCGRSTLNDLLDEAFQPGAARCGNVLLRAANRWLAAEHRPREHESWSGLRHTGLETYVDSVLRLAMQIADALDHAHRQGILHGDLKPSNVLLSSEGRPLVLDFNLSREASHARPLCGGTLPYMPPEYLQVVAGHDGELEPPTTFCARTDIFSFGALLFELLTGRTPAMLPRGVDDTAQVADSILQQLHERSPSIRRLNPLVGGRLEAKILRCLALDPADRPGSMAEVKQALAAEARLVPVLGRQARTRPIAFAAVLSALAVAAFAVSAYFATRPPAYQSQFDGGLAAYEAGEFRQAATHFESAIAAHPTFTSARFQLGRARIALGDVDLAITAFEEPARFQQDPHSMAYLGYCFNLKQFHVAAIPWYEKVLDHGGDAVAVRNNLAASYLQAASGLSKTRRIEQTEKHLLRALELGEPPLAVRLNWIRLEIARTEMDASYRPIDAWPHVRAVLAAKPANPIVRAIAAKWYVSLTDRGEASGDTRYFWEQVDLERLNEAEVKRLRSVIPPLADALKTADAADPIPAAEVDAGSSLSLFFLEPATLSLAARN